MEDSANHPGSHFLLCWGHSKVGDKTEVTKGSSAPLILGLINFIKKKKKKANKQKAGLMILLQRKRGLEQPSRPHRFLGATRVT